MALLQTFSLRRAGGFFYEQKGKILMKVELINSNSYPRKKG